MRPSPHSNPLQTHRRSAMFPGGKAKAKEHVYALATQLLLQGSAAGAAVAHQYYHHHHHHGQQLSTSGCLSPSQQQPQPPPSASAALPTLTLEDVSLFRVADFRLLFLARCCQLHALSGKRHVVLSAQALETLHDVLRVILREANNDGDFLAVRMVYALSEMVGSYVGNGGQHLQSARAALRRHEAWDNVELYKAALEECVARDKQQWLGLQAPLLQLVGSSEGGGGGSGAIIRLLLLLRLRAIAEAIVQLRCPTVTGEDEALVQGLLDYCREAHDQSFTLAEVYAPPAPPVMLWLLDAATRVLLLHEKSTEGDGTWHLHRGLRGATTTTATGASSIPNVLRWASERAMAASHWPCLGFSAHHALLLFVATHAERLAKAGPVLLHRPPPPAASGMTGGGGGGMCLCGKPSYAEWSVLGGYGLTGGAAERIRELAPSLLCEPCFRSLLREYPLPQQHHRPPQAVGCAPLPAAATLHTPRSLAALAAAAADIMQPSEVVVERQPSPPPLRPLSTTTTVVLGLTTTELPEPSVAPAPPAAAAAAAIVEEPQPAAPAALSSSSTSSSKAPPSKTAAATTAGNAPPPRPPSRKVSSGVSSSSSSSQRLVKEGDAALRRRSVSGSGSRAGPAAAIAPAPQPPRPQSTRERGSSHLGASGSAGASGRPRLRKSELMALLMSGELEVLKHVRGPFGGAPHRRILFVDDASTESACLHWREGKKGAKTLKKGGGLPLRHLLDVRRKARVVTMLFKERPLVVEAYTEERAELIEAVFMYVFNKNRKMTTLMAATSASSKK